MQPVKEVPISPIPTQTNDISINLVTSVNLLEKVCLKGHLISKRCHLSLYGWVKV
jgi:hypothetical protein